MANLMLYPHPFKIVIVIELKALLGDTVPEFLAFFKKPLVIEAPEFKPFCRAFHPGFSDLVPVGHVNLQL